MKLTLIEAVVLVSFFIGLMIPVVSGLIYFIKENNRLEKSHPSKK
jgi:hypothetical protein